MGFFKAIYKMILSGSFILESGTSVEALLLSISPGCWLNVFMRLRALYCNVNLAVGVYFLSTESYRRDSVTFVLERGVGFCCN